MPNSEHQPYWFEYAITVGRFTAIPVHPLGWLTLIAFTVVPIGISLLILPPLAQMSPILGIAGLLATILTSIYGLFRVAVAKGRRRY